MSTISNSDDSCRPPDNFHISLSINEHDDGSSHWSEECCMKCPLCLYSRKNFYCRDCIRNGDFYNTNNNIKAANNNEK